MMLALVLVGASTAPLLACMAQSESERCPMQQAQESDHRCHDTEAPAAQMSCCCSAKDSSVPPLARDTSVNADTALSATTAFGDVEPARTPRHVVETTTNRTRTRPLFTLFSAFLI